MTSPPQRATLHLSPPVHVAAAGEVVPVRRKGLAMLAYVALEGPTRRERLADVLWDHPRALRNLRVELHRLRAAFSPVGIDPIARVTDPVVLGREVAVAPLRGGSDLLEGLEDVSSEFQAWLAYRRAVAETGVGREVRAALLDDLANRVSPPFVVVLQGVPGSGRRTVARELARRLGLPFGEANGQRGPGLRYVGTGAQHGADAEDLADRIRADRDGVWAIERSAFGPDTTLLLHLRAAYDAERWRFERLEPLPWREARHLLDPRMGFHAGASLYLSAGGNPGYLNELRKMAAGAALENHPVPQRIRAAVELETQRLSAAARAALERLSEFEGRYSPEVLAALDTGDELDELERHGWLRFDGEAWSLANPMLGRLLRSTIQPGARRRLHDRLTQRLRLGDTPAGPGRAADGVADESTADRAAAANAAALGGGERPRVVRVPAGAERWLGEPRVEAANAHAEAGRVVWSRLAHGARPERVTWPLEPGRILLRLTGRALVRPGADDAEPVPALLRATVQGTASTEVRWRAMPPADRPDAMAEAPAIAAVFDQAFVANDARAFQLACDGAGAVLELDVRCYDVDASDAADDALDAIELSTSAPASLDLLAIPAAGGGQRDEQPS